MVACNSTGLDLLPACSASDNFPKMNHWVVGEPISIRPNAQPLGALPAWGDSLRQDGRGSPTLRLVSMLAGYSILETRMDGECGIHCMNIFQAGRVERSFPKSRHRKTTVFQHERSSTPVLGRAPVLPLPRLESPVTVGRGHREPVFPEFGPAPRRGEAAFSRAVAAVLVIPCAAEGTGPGILQLAETRRCLAEWMKSVAADPDFHGIFVNCQEFDDKHRLKKVIGRGAADGAAERKGGAPPLASASASASAVASAATLGSAAAVAPDKDLACRETPRKRKVPPDDLATPPKDDGSSKTFVECLGGHSKTTFFRPPHLFWTLFRPGRTVGSAGT